MVYLMLSIIISSAVMLASIFLSKKTFMDKEKTSPFECGFDPYSSTRSPFSLRFFKIAIIFLIFDIEIVLVLPLPMVNQNPDMMFLSSSMFILAIIFLGLVYEWNQGSLDWMK